jgi:HEPN domain-containing protein
MDKMKIMEATKEWFEYAERDLTSAKYLMSMYPLPLEIIAFHSQQCGEKYLKSYLVYQDQDVIKTHDLFRLCKLCAKFDEEFMSLKEQCETLTKYTEVTRYPTMKLDLTDYHIKKAIEYAEEIKSFVLERIVEEKND